VEAWYPQIRALHLGAVLTSGGLFLVRGFLLNALGQAWAMARPLRIASYAIDTVLLGAAIALVFITRQYPFVDGWLTAKVVLLVVYIVLGSFALKRGRTRAIRIGFWLAALAVFGFIWSVARAKSPLGVFA
jgi:uncharacterized membrane protein SirB2